MTLYFHFYDTKLQFILPSLLTWTKPDGVLDSRTVRLLGNLKLQWIPRSQITIESLHLVAKIRQRASNLREIVGKTKVKRMKLSPHFV